jgi:hypothetical protein
MNIYEGTTSRATMTFKNPTNVLTDPTTVTVRVKAGPTVTEYTYGTGTAIVRASPGVYHITVPTTATTATTWVIQAIGTGACAAVNEASFIVMPRTM